MTEGTQPPVGGSSPNEQPERTPPFSKEPEGGPFAREQAFLQERLATLRPRTDEEGDQQYAANYFSDSSDVALDTGALPAGFRRNLMRQYRERQKPNYYYALPDLSRATNWVPIGPSVVLKGQAATKPATSGRVIGIAVAPDGRRIYAASANGGVWRSEDEGKSWRSLMDAWDLDPTTEKSDSLACGAIALVPGDTADKDRIYVGTGEGQGGAYFGIGPIVSTDGGRSWAVEPSYPTLAGSAFYALAVDPDDPDRVVGATKQGVYRREQDGNGSFHWVRKPLPGAQYPSGAQYSSTSVVVARGNNKTTFYAAVHNYPSPGPTNWTYPPPSGTPIYFSGDSGSTWNKLEGHTPTFPNIQVGRITLATQQNNPDIIYAFTEQGKVYRFDTDLADNEWRSIANVPPSIVGTQGWYDLAIAVDPNDVNCIYLGGATVKADINGNYEDKFGVGYLVDSSGTTSRSWAPLKPGEWSGALYRCKIEISRGSAPVPICSSHIYIGCSVHADIHAIVFAPNDSNKLWIGCDGGVFYSTNPTGNGAIFEARNAGLQTLCMHHLALHPTDPTVIFCGTQDNGGLRFTGEEAWDFPFASDAGYPVINWNTPNEVLCTYSYGCINYNDFGKPNSKNGRNVKEIINSKCECSEDCLFYAPLVGTPLGSSKADRVAFGSIRPWISDDFGLTWQSIPNNDPGDPSNPSKPGDRLVAPIRSLIFASADKLYAGTEGGWVNVFGSWQWTTAAVSRFDYDDPTKQWSKQEIPMDSLKLKSGSSIGLSITDIAVDPADPTGDSIYITFGGILPDTPDEEHCHVWHYDGNGWESRSGNPATQTSLLNVQANAIVVDPDNPDYLYVGADIGVWRSINAGKDWEKFSEGLPDAAVIDLKIYKDDKQCLLRASTHGRGVFERPLDSNSNTGVLLYIRDKQLDLQGSDIKVCSHSAPDINFLQFVELDELAEFSTTDITADKTYYVYVQVHNRGVIPADNVRVVLLLSKTNNNLPPDLPSDHAAQIQENMPIVAGWQTIGTTAIIDDVRAGFPQIATFNLELKNLAQCKPGESFCLLALVDHQNPFAGYRLNLTNPGDSLQREKKVIGVTKIDDSYHVRIFNSSGNEIPIRESFQFPDDLDQQLEEAINNPPSDTQREKLIQKIVSNLGTYAKKFDDPYESTETDTQTNCRDNRKAAYKILEVS